MLKVEKYLNAVKFNPFYGLRLMMKFPSFLSQYRKFKSDISEAPAFKLGRFKPMLTEDSAESGTGHGVYFYQDLLVAQRIFTLNPVRHVDIGSRIDGFVAHIASFRAIDVFDIRPLTSDINNVTFQQCDLMSDLPEELLGCTDSLSCLHTLEHFGLGRYGDMLDVNGHLKGFANLTRILKSNGRLYFSVPLGSQRIEFNAHRVFSLSYLLDMIKSASFRIETFSYIDDSGALHADVALSPEGIERNCKCNYGCAVFELIKI